jgi:hypothetical protein
VSAFVGLNIFESALLYLGRHIAFCRTYFSEGFSPSPEPPGFIVSFKQLMQSEQEGFAKNVKGFSFGLVQLVHTRFY